MISFNLQTAVVYMLAVEVLTLEPDHSSVSLQQVKHGDSNVICVGNKITNITQHPYLVGIFLYGTYFCAGTIVNQNWAVTIGSCVGPYHRENITVLAGSDYRNIASGTWYTVSEVAVHPDYEEFSFSSDVACVRVAGGFVWSSAVRAATLPASPPADGTILTVSGWGGGLERDLSARRGEVLESYMEWLPRHYCNATFFSQHVTWDDTMGCAINQSRNIFCGTGWGFPFTRKKVFYGHYIGELFGDAKKNLGSDNMMMKRHKPKIIYAILTDIAGVVGWIKTVVSSYNEAV